MIWLTDLWVGFMELQLLAPCIKKLQLLSLRFRVIPTYGVHRWYLWWHITKPSPLETTLYNSWFFIVGSNKFILNPLPLSHLFSTIMKTLPSPNANLILSSVLDFVLKLSLAWDPISSPISSLSFIIVSHKLKMSMWHCRGGDRGGGQGPGPPGPQIYIRKLNFD